MFAKKLYPALAKALEENGIDEPRFAQKEFFTAIKTGKDTACIAPYHTGRTTAMACAVIQMLQRAIDDVPRALIFVPDINEAEALLAIFENLARYTSLRIFSAHGGKYFEEQKTAIYMGSDVVIGTPNRLGELYAENVLNLSGLKYFVLENSELFIRQDANDHISRLAESAMKSKFILISDSFTPRVDRFIERYMNDESIIEIDEDDEDEDGCEETGNCMP